MRIRFDSSEVPSFEEQDLFDRRLLAEQILSVSRSIEHPATFLLNAPWGSGKSYFLKQFMQLAESQQVPTIYFDAFKHDLSGDAFSSLVGCVVEHLEDGAPGSHLAASILGGASKVGVAVLRGGLTAAASYMTAGILNSRHVDGASEALSAAIEEGGDAVSQSVVEEALKGLLKSHAASSKSVSEFQNIVERAAKTLLENKRAPERSKLIFVIDELDRCRPDFALDVIECVKHIFGVSGIDYIVSTDKSHLEASISHIYGDKIDKSAYMEKFFDIKVGFPIEFRRKNSIIAEYIRHIKETAFRVHDSNYDYALQYVDFLSIRMGLSLRDVEKICQYCTMAYTISRNIPPEVGAFISIIRHKSESFYDVIRRGGVSEKNAQYAIDMLCLSLDSVNEIEAPLVSWVYVLLAGHARVNNDLDKDVAANYASGLRGVRDVVPFHCRNHFDSLTVI